MTFKRPEGGVLVVSASPHPRSRPDWLGDHLRALLAHRGHPTAHTRVRDLPAAALLLADTGHRDLRAALADAEGAAGIVFVTPIYRAAYAGLLKVFLDELPRHGLRDKAVLPVGVGGSPAHLLALDYALRPVLQAMAARHVVRGHFGHDRELPLDGAPGAGVLAGLAVAADTLSAALVPLPAEV
ncbi:NAD(P)H-dependent oxidoreductase [Actinosynnema sp.]|uniref:NAD(P)H-dependent oxidoreductase n=1 Tax=Actinosynnema sp. TaxID=1872144 RepID=UPI003F85EF6F